MGCDKTFICFSFIEVEVLMMMFVIVFLASTGKILSADMKLAFVFDVFCKTHSEWLGLVH